MPAFVFIFITIETVLLLIFAVLFLHKTSALNKVLKDTGDLRNNFEGQMRDEKEREDFLAMLVHELRSPLAVMKGAADLILKDAHNLSKEQVETLLEQIKTSSSGMLKIVNDILDVSKIDSGKFAVEKDLADLNTILKDECEYYKALANSKIIDLEYKTDPDLQKFQFDADRIRQVMNNLLSNAIKFTPENGKIKVGTRKLQRYAQIYVSDSGDGISDDMKHKLFHKFVQLPNHNNHGKDHGTGLGLVVCKGIIEAHGGAIWIEDNEPKGASFVFNLPLS